MRKKIREWIEDANLSDFFLFLVAVAAILYWTSTTVAFIVRIFLT